MLLKTGVVLFFGSVILMMVAMFAPHNLSDRAKARVEEAGENLSDMIGDTVYEVKDSMETIPDFLLGFVLMGRGIPAYLFGAFMLFVTACVFNEQRLSNQELIGILFVSCLCWWLITAGLLLAGALWLISRPGYLLNRYFNS